LAHRGALLRFASQLNAYFEWNFPEHINELFPRHSAPQRPVPHRIAAQRAIYQRNEAPPKAGHF